MIRKSKGRIAVAATMALAAVGLSGSVNADNGTDTEPLREAVSAAAIMDHLEALQGIAAANEGNRSAGTTGHIESAEYVEAQLLAAGYTPYRQPFSYDETIVDEATLSSPTRDYEYGVDFLDMDFASEGDITAPVQAVDINLGGDRASTSGCEASDFDDFVLGNIALIQRGTCTFRIKADNALAAGAAGVIIFNQGNVSETEDRFSLFGGTLSPPVFPLPVVSATFEVGQELAALDGVVLDFVFEAHTVTVNTFNVLADTAGRTDRTVVVGGHLDSVPEGPGINDNGSGSAAILETAIQMATLGITPENRVRFAFWSGEEDGLIGSDYYVSQLSARDIKDHAVNLNFDMVGSPNFVRFVYDGDGDAFGTKGPNGSGVVEDVFLDYFASQGLATEPTAFDGRSDYFGFIENGIPAGGLFTGAEGIKSAAQAAVYGGTAGNPYDPCYHQACDDLDNINEEVLEQMADAIAHATLTFAETTAAVSGTGKGGGPGMTGLKFKGDRARR